MHVEAGYRCLSWCIGIKTLLKTRISQCPFYFLYFALLHDPEATHVQERRRSGDSLKEVVHSLVSSGELRSWREETSVGHEAEPRCDATARSQRYGRRGTCPPAGTQPQSRAIQTDLPFSDAGPACQFPSWQMRRGPCSAVKVCWRGNFLRRTEGVCSRSVAS